MQSVTKKNSTQPDICEKKSIKKRKDKKTSLRLENNQPEPQCLAEIKKTLTELPKLLPNYISSLGIYIYCRYYVSYPRGALLFGARCHYLQKMALGGVVKVLYKEGTSKSSTIPPKRSIILHDSIS